MTLIVTSWENQELTHLMCACDSEPDTRWHPSILALITRGRHNSTWFWSIKCHVCTIMSSFIHYNTSEQTLLLRHILQSSVFITFMNVIRETFSFHHYRILFLILIKLATRWPSSAIHRRLWRAAVPFTVDVCNLDGTLVPIVTTEGVLCSLSCSSWRCVYGRLLDVTVAHHPGCKLSLSLLEAGTSAAVDTMHLVENKLR